jgi:hypothetical protein
MSSGPVFKKIVHKKDFWDVGNVTLKVKVHVKVEAYVFDGEDFVRFFTFSSREIFVWPFWPELLLITILYSWSITLPGNVRSYLQ